MAEGRQAEEGKSPEEIAKERVLSRIGESRIIVEGRKRMGISKNNLEGYILDRLQEKHPEAKEIELIQYKGSMYRHEMISVTYTVNKGKRIHTEVYRP